MYDKWNADQSGDDICSWLCDLHSGKAKKRNTDQQHGNGDCTGANKGKNRRNRWFLYALVEHIYRNRERHKHHTNSGEPKRNLADFNNSLFLLENGDDLFCSNDAYDRQATNKNDSEAD